MSLPLTERIIRLEVQTSVEGPLAAVAKAPRLQFAHIEGVVDFLDRTETPRLVRVEFPVSSLQVISEDIGELERQHILDVVFKQVFGSRAHEVVRFESSGIVVAREEKGGVPIDGQLSFLGVSRPIHLEFDRDHSRERLYRCSTSLLQSDFGIQPLSAMMGAIRCRDELRIEIVVSLDGAGAH